jgi:uncharacterized protein YdhG (YjbR/CyaY superfamily)
MQSKAKTVAEYLKEVPEDRREALIRLRKLCKTLLSKHDEGMDYGMPCYKRDGVVEFAFASQKNSINVYVAKQDVMKSHRARLKGLSVGKGCIRYPKPEKLDFSILTDLLKDTSASTGKAC